MITSEQIRASIAVLRWSRRILGEKSGVNERTIQRIVEGSGIPNSNAQYIDAIEKAIINTGRITFIEDNGVTINK